MELYPPKQKMIRIVFGTFFGRYENMKNFLRLNLVFLVSGASYETTFALVLFDSPFSENKVKQN